MRIIAVSLILFPSHLSKHQHFTSSTEYISRIDSLVIYILESKNAYSSATMGLLDKLRGKKKRDSSQAGDSLHCYSTDKTCFRPNFPIERY